MSTAFIRSCLKTKVILFCRKLRLAIRKYLTKVQLISYHKRIIVYTMANRRQSARIPFRKRVEYGLSAPTFVGYTFNLSEGGIGVKAHRVLTPRSKLLIQIHMNSDNLGESIMNEIIGLEGTVAWVSSVLPGILPTMGIKFSSRNDDIKNVFRRRMNQ